MATNKLSAKQLNRIKQLGIDTDDEAKARKKLLKILEDNDIPDCESDDTDSLIEMAMVFKDNLGDEEETAEEVEEEEEPVAKKKPAPVAATTKKTTKKPAPVEEEEDEETEQMDQLVEEVSTKNLKTTKKADNKIADKKVAKKGNKKRKLLGRRWEDLTDKEKQTAVLPFRKIFPKDKFEINLLQKSFTVSYLGKTSPQNIMKYHLLRLLADGKLEGVFVAHRFKEPEELAAFLPDDVVSDRTLKKGDSCSYIHPLHQDEVMKLMTKTDFLKQSIELAQKQDKKMQANRENLEKSLNADKKTVNKKPVADEEEEEEPAPKKGTTPPAAKQQPKSTGKGVKAVKKSVVVYEAPEEDDEEEEEEEPAPKAAKKVVATATAKKKK